MYQVLIFEILGILQPSSRALIMALSLYSLIALILLVLPAAWFYFVISAANATSDTFRSAQVCAPSPSPHISMMK